MNLNEALQECIKVFAMFRPAVLMMRVALPELDYNFVFNRDIPRSHIEESHYLLEVPFASIEVMESYIMSSLSDIDLEYIQVVIVDPAQ